MVCEADQREGFPGVAERMPVGKGGLGEWEEDPFPPNDADLEEIERLSSSLRY